MSRTTDKMWLKYVAVSRTVDKMWLFYEDGPSALVLKAENRGEFRKKRMGHSMLPMSVGRSYHTW